MSLAINQCVYNQIQRSSISLQRKRSFREQFLIFLATRSFDVAVAIVAAIAASAAGAHAAQQPLTREILRYAIVGVALKSGSMAFAGLLSFGSIKTPFVVLATLLGSAFGTNILLMAYLSNQIYGRVVNELLIAAVVASVPLCFCFAYYYGAFRVPITFGSIPIDALGAYVFVRMAENQGYPICPRSVALTAGAVFGTVSSAAVTLLSCCVIGRKRSFHFNNFESDACVRVTTYADRCGNRVYVDSSVEEYWGERGGYGHSTTTTSGTIYNSAHGLGIVWDLDSVTGHFGWFISSSRDHTTTRTSGSIATTVRSRGRFYDY